MALPRTSRTLTTPEEVDAFLAEHPRAVLLKLGLCHKNVVARQEVEAQLSGRSDVPLALIHVVECRPASDHVAVRTGIVHESPQLIAFRDGQPVFERDNWDISPEAVHEALSRLERTADGQPVESLATAARAR